VVAGVSNPRSLGVARYAARLAGALEDEQITYSLTDRARGRGPAHFHLANSSRAFLLQGTTRRARFVVTVHDVRPRTSSLLPLYRLLAYPPLARRAAAVVAHSKFAADLLVREAGRRPVRLELIPFPAPRPREKDRDRARRALGWPPDSLIAVVPGVIKGVKLIRETLAAASGLADWKIGLAGKLVDRELVQAAYAQGALVLDSPDDVDYERAVVASDCVLCLRSDSVGETNAPLLDALGAGRAVLATATGSVSEVAGGAALYCDGTERSIRAGLAALSDSAARADLERAAAQSAAELTWEASAAAHAALFREVFDV
jgi:glycosyltransferase involved in cell wall biosynthesis